MALAFGVPFLAVAYLALTSRSRALVRTQQERIDREELPPDTQETPEHFALMEEEMQEIRARMDPDLSDLRAHVNSRSLGEGTGRSVRTRLRFRLRSLLDHRDSRE